MRSDYRETGSLFCEPTRATFLPTIRLYLHDPAVYLDVKKVAPLHEDVLYISHTLAIDLSKFLDIIVSGIAPLSRDQTVFAASPPDHDRLHPRPRHVNSR